MSKIFKASNKLNNHNVIINTVGADPFKLITEVIISVEIETKNNTPVITGRLIVDDLYDLNSLVPWETSTITVEYTDLFEDNYAKNFVITKIIEGVDDAFKKTFIIELQDTFSYKLSKSFLSKGFNSSLTTALKEYIKYLELDDDLDIEDSLEFINFVVPKNISNLDFFVNELRNYGFIFYQNKTSIIVKSVANLAVSALPDNSDKIYLNETDNQYYKNKIIDLQVGFMNREDVDHKTRSIAFNNLTKTIDIDDTNDLSPYYLGDNNINLQETENIQDLTSLKDVTQSHLDFNKHLLNMHDSFNKQSTIEMIVNGYVINDINQIFELKLKGNLGTNTTQDAGNKIINGKYVSHTVVDKIIGDTLIQKIKLHRVNMNTL
jgi:hypothetical protein